MRVRPAIVFVLVYLLAGVVAPRQGHAAWLIEADVVNLTFGPEGADGVPGTGDDLPPGSVGISAAYNDGIYQAGGPPTLTAWVVLLSTAVPLGDGTWEYSWTLVNLGTGSFQSYADDGGGPNFLQSPPLEPTGSFEVDGVIGGAPETGLWGGSWYTDVIAPGGAMLYRPAPSCGDGTVTGNEQCDDGNIIDGDGCDSNCTHTGCGNGVVTPGEACDTGGESVACDPDCTIVVCGDGVANATAGEQCDDGNTIAGDCCSPSCLSEAHLCDDGNPCTDDGCDPVSGCTYADNQANCDDGNACTQTDACQSGVCVGTSPLSCAATDQCHDIGVCDPATGFCSDPARPDGSACDDGNLCTQNDGCVGGQCVGGPALPCDDQNACTLDGCLSQSGCIHLNNDFAVCDDGDVCTLSDTCTGGACVAGGALACDDGDPCTTDGCDPLAGCVYSQISGCPCIGVSLSDPVHCRVGQDCTVSLALSTAGLSVDAVDGGLQSDLAVACTSQCAPGLGAINGDCQVDGPSCGFNVSDLTPPITSFVDGQLATLTLSCQAEGSGQLCAGSLSARSDGLPVETCPTSCSGLDCSTCVAGDVNQNGFVDAGDPVGTVLCLIGDDPAAADCSCAADCNCVGGLEASDPTCTILRLLGGYEQDPCAGQAGGAVAGFSFPGTPSVVPRLRIKATKPRAKAGTARTRLSLRLKGRRASVVASARVDLVATSGILKTRLARRLVRSGFSLVTRVSTRGRQLWILPPQALPIRAAGRGRLIRLLLADGSAEPAITGVELGSTSGFPLP